jgi:hypothetical protein
MIESVSALAISLLYLASCAALGRLLCRAVSFEVDPGECLALGIPLGMGIYGLLVLAAGLVRMLYPAVAWGFLLAPLLLWCVPSLRPRTGGLRLPAAKVDRFLVALIAWGAAVTVLKALEPPASYDGVAYHLANAGRYVRHHALTDSHWISISYWPNHFGALYAFGLLLGNAQVPSLINASTGLAAAGLLAAWGAKRFSLSTGLGAAALHLSLPMTRELSGGMWIDSGSAMFVVLALYFAEQAWVDGRGQAGWILSGASAGFACASKFTGLLALPVVLAAVVVAERRRPPQCVLTLLLVTLTAGVAGGGWYLRSWIETGSPTFPFLTSLFTPRPDWAPYAAGATEGFQRVGVTHRSAIDLLTLPWRLVADPFYVEKRVDYLMVPFYGVLLWYLVRSRGSSGAIARLGMATVALTLLWFMGTGHNSRHGFPIVILICLLMAVMIHQLGVTRGHREAGVSTALPGILILVLTLWNLQFVPRAFRVAAGVETRESFLRREMKGLHAANLYLKRETPPGTRVLFCSEIRGYYCDRDLVLELHPLTGPDDVLRFHEDLHRDRIDYVLYNPGNPHGRASNIGLWAAQDGELVFAQDKVFVYRVRP